MRVTVENCTSGGVLSYGENVPLAEFMYLVITRMQSESYCRELYLWWSFELRGECTSGGVLSYGENVPLVEFL